MSESRDDINACAEDLPASDDDFVDEGDDFVDADDDFVDSNDFIDPDEPRSVLGRLLAWAVPSIACCVIGILIGVGLDYGADPPQQLASPLSGIDPNAIATDQQRQPYSVTDPLQGQTPQQAVLRGDHLLATADVIGAVRIFQAVKERYPKSVSDELRYRLALCSESLGNHEQAIAEYRNLSRHPLATAMGLASRLGQARVWIRLGRLEAAKSILCSLRLVSDQFGANEIIHAEIAHGLALIRLYEVHQELPDDLLADKSVAGPKWYWRAEDGLKLLANAATPAADADKQDKPDAIEVIRRFGDTPEDIQMSVIANRQDLASVIEQLVAQSGLNFTWSDAARKVAAARSTAIALNNSNLADILDDLLDPAGLVRADGDGKFVIDTPHNVSRENRIGFKLLMAERAARHAVTQFPDDPQAAASYLALGNLAFVDQRWPDAKTFYEHGMRLYPRSAHRTEMWFNYAKVLLQTHEIEAALEALLYVVDEGRGHPLEGVAYLYAGRLALDTGQHDTAIAHLSRAVAVSNDHSHLPTAVVTLATAYVMDNRPGAAISLLMNHRESLKEAPFRNVAGYVTATARFRSASTELDLVRAGRELVTASANVTSNDFFGDHGYLVLANTFESLGLFDEMETTYRRALKANTTIYLRDRILFQLADYHRRNARTAEARQELQQLAEEGAEHWQRRARLTVAEIDLLAGAAEKSLAECRALIGECETTDEQHQVLRLMGRVYQQQAEHDHAAICFAGMLPRAAGPESEGEVQ